MMNDAALGDFAVKLVDGFFAGSLAPGELFEQLSMVAGGSPEIGRRIREAWTRGNMARAASGKAPLDPSVSLPLAGVFGKAAPPPADSPAEAVPEAADALIKLVRKRCGLEGEGLSKVNAGRPMDERALVGVVYAAIRSQRLVPRLLVPYLSGRFFEKFEELLGMVVDQRDGSLHEVLQYFGVYLLLNGASQDQLASLRLSPPLESFVSDKIGRMRQIFYVAMLFAHSFAYVLFAQTYEIRSKYAQMPDDQKGKLRKLYEAEDRLSLLVTNAGNVGMRRILEFGIEAREIQTVLKKFLSSNRRLVTPADLFQEARP